jgi:hypothetical protein
MQIEPGVNRQIGTPKLKNKQEPQKIGKKGAMRYRGRMRKVKL